MLNIFHVNQGDNLVIEVNNAFGKVRNLKEKIRDILTVPTEDHVLLLRDGTVLKNDEDVFSTNAGIESNPIFLYTKNYAEVLSQAPTHFDLTDKINSALDLSYSYETVEIRTKIIKKMNEYSQDIIELNSEAYHSQLLQYTGWIAIVKNLEQVVATIGANYESFKDSLIYTMKDREEHMKLLKSSGIVLKTLENIQLPIFISKSEEGQKDPDCDNLCDHLFDEYWVEKIKEESEFGVDIMHKITLDVIDELEHDMKIIREEEQDKEYKYISGMQDRQRDLEMIDRDGKQLAEQINDFCQIFEANFERAKKTSDVSVFPDLCRSHESHLIHVQQNYSKIRNFRKRILNSKYELSSNINRRFGWVNRLHTLSREFHNSVVVNSGMLGNLKDILGRSKNVANTPDLYYRAVSEILRRNVYVHNYNKWAYKLHGDCSQIYETESSLRDKFSINFYKNMLSSKIKGLDEKPNSYGCNPGPLEFDADLPSIDKSDMEMVLSSCPEELKHLFIIEEDYGIPQLLCEALKPEPVLKDTPNTSGTEDCPEDFASAAASLDTYDTEPEDFEEIAQVMEETVKYVSDCRQHLLSGGDTDDPCIELLEKNDKELQTDSISLNDYIAEETINEYKKELAIQVEEEIRFECAHKHETEMMSLTSELEEKHQKELNQCKDLWEAQTDDITGKIDEERKKLKKELDAALDNCRQQHKLEIEGLRSRFRMMTTANMDKSPSETSLEKFDHQDYMESLRKTLDQEYALNLDAQMKIEEEKKNEQLKKLEAEKDEEYSDALKQIHQDKDRVIEDLRLRVGLLTDELEKQRKSQRTIILNKRMATLEDRLVHYERELSYMTMQLNFFKTKDKTTDQECPDHWANTLGNVDAGFPNIMLYSCFSDISISSTNNGETVIFAWDKRYNHYRAVVDERIGLFFLHKACHPLLGIIKDCPNKHPYKGKIYNREKCKLKKEENRFGLPKDSFFWRLRACHPKADPPITPEKEDISITERKQEVPKERKVSREPVFAEIPEMASAAADSSPVAGKSDILSNIPNSRKGDPIPYIECSALPYQSIEPVIDSDDSSTISDATSNF